MSPYNPWVKGITSGFQTGLANFNRYVVFDSIDDNIEYSSNNSFNQFGTNSFTVEMLVKVDDDGHLCNNNGESINAGWNLIRTSSVARSRIADGSSFAQISGTTNINDGEFHKLELEVDRTNNLLKVRTDDGDEQTVDISAIGSISNTNPLVLMDTQSKLSPAGGFIKYVKIFNSSSTLVFHAAGSGKEYVNDLTPTINGSPAKQNIFGTTYNATIDIFGNTITNIRPNRIVTGKQG